MPDPFAYYAPEWWLFSDLARGFAETGQLEPAALYLILDWKASRARTKHLRRLTRLAGGGFDLATKRVAPDICPGISPEQRLENLMNK